MSTHWNDSQPIYWQLKERTVAMILDGTLAEGEALPSVRTVASEFHLNPITVSKSYQALVDDGLVEKRRGLGMFVRDGARESLIASERDKFLNEEWPALLSRIEKLPKRESQKKANYFSMGSQFREGMDEWLEADAAFEEEDKRKTMRTQVRKCIERRRRELEDDEETAEGDPGLYAGEGVMTWDCLEEDGSRAVKDLSFQVTLAAPDALQIVIEGNHELQTTVDSNGYFRLNQSIIFEDMFIRLSGLVLRSPDVPGLLLCDQIAGDTAVRVDGKMIVVCTIKFKR